MTATLDPVTRGRLARDIQLLGEEVAGIISVEPIDRYLAASLDQFANAALLRAMDNLHDTGTINDETWSLLAATL